MTEHLRRDPSLNPEQSRAADPNAPEKVERPVVNNPDSRTLVTPPGDPRASRARLRGLQQHAHRKRNELPCLQPTKRASCVPVGIAKTCGMPPTGEVKAIDNRSLPSGKGRIPAR
jgi:hypothetical protein